MKKSFLTTLLIVLSILLYAQSGSITNIQVSQRTDGSGFVDVYFDLTGTGSNYFISLEASFDGGQHYSPVPVNYTSGDIGPINPGNSKHIVWDGMGSFPNTLSLQAKLKVIASTNSAGNGTVTDIDGNVYQTVMIGSQEWMAENLKVTHYRNGDIIPNVTGDSQWGGLTTGAYCWYNNDVSWKDAYGALYNWYAAIDSRGLCPAGWHTPSDNEWTILTDFLGGQILAGGKMKSTRKEPDAHPRWDLPNTGATNESGFSGLPGGSRFFGGPFYSIGANGNFWSSGEFNSYYAWTRYLDYRYSSVYRGCSSMHDGLSVRCLRD